MERKIMPLMESQTGLFALTQALPSQALNMAVRINLECEINESRALEALRLTAGKLEYCRIRLCRNEDGSIGQYFSEVPPQGIELLDYSSYPEKKIDKAIEKLASAPFSKDLLETQLYNFKLILGRDGQYILFFNLCHLVADAYGLMCVVTYFDRVYEALDKGMEAPDPKCTTEAMIESEKRMETSSKLEKENARLEKEFAEEPHFTSINGLGSAEFVKGTQYGKPQNPTQFMVGSLPLRIPKELVDRINEQAMEKNISPLAFYLLALRTYLGAVSKTDDVTVTTTASRRSTLVQKNGGLSIAKLVFNRSIVSPETGFGAALKYMNTRHNEFYRTMDADVLTFEEEFRQRFHTAKGAIYESVVLTFQPYLNVNNANLQFKARFLNTGLAAFPLYINLMPMDSTGDLWAEYLYAKLYIKPDNIEKFHAFQLEFLEEGMAHPEMTIAELVEKCM